MKAYVSMYLSRSIGTSCGEFSYNRFVVKAI